jgi:hypothetical protein
LSVCPLSDSQERSGVVHYFTATDRNEQRLLYGFDPSPGRNADVRSEGGPIDGKLRREGWRVSCIRLVTGGEQRHRRRGCTLGTDSPAHLPRSVAWIASQGGDSNAVLRRVDGSALRFDRQAVGGAQVRQRSKRGTRSPPAGEHLLGCCVICDRCEQFGETTERIGSVGAPTCADRRDAARQSLIPLRIEGGGDHAHHAEVVQCREADLCSLRREDAFDLCADTFA